jgi:hypothetical protein
MEAVTKSRIKHLGAFALYFTALWFLWDTVAVYPLKIFVVLLHETSHAAAALATGGYVERIVLDPAQGGACYCPGGNAFLTLSAGYLGSLLWGGGILLAARSQRVRPGLVTGTLGVLTLGLTLLYIRSLFGFGFGLAFAAALLVLSRKASPGVNRTVATVLGLTSVLYAILDIKSDILDRPHLRSDAAMLAELTGIPTMAWGFIWIAAALVLAFWLVRKAYWDAPATPDRAGWTEA